MPGIIFEHYSEAYDDATLISIAQSALVRAISGTPNAQIPYNANTTPAVTKIAAGILVVTTTATMNLTSLPNLHGTAAMVTFNLLRPRYMEFRTPDANTGAVKVAPGSSNGYDFLGSDNSCSLSLGRGAKIAIWPGTNTTDVDAISTATDVALDVTCTGTQTIYYVFACG